MKLSAVLIALNEERNVGECLESLSFCDEIIVVDSGSSDRTVEEASAHTKKVFRSKFENYSAQKNFGIQQAAGDWVLLVDADERVSRSLAAEIRNATDRPENEGYYFLRLNKIFGRWMKHGANKNDYQLRLVKRQKAVFQGIVHERIYLHGKTSRLKSPLLHYSTNDLSDYMKKCNVYTSMEAGIYRERKDVFSPAKMKRRPFLVFIYRAFWQKGILDGLEGLLFCVLSAYYEFVKRAKHWELSKKGSGR